MKSLDFQQDFFHLFDLPVRFEIDSNELDQRYRALQTQVHPDKFAHLVRVRTPAFDAMGDARERGLSDACAIRCRAGVICLSLHGVDTQEETNTAMPVDFLMQQMEWREALQDAIQSKDGDALDALHEQARQETKPLQQQLCNRD